MNQPPYPPNPDPGQQWSSPPPGYGPQGPQGFPGPPMGAEPPPGKKPFRFQSWMLGAIIIPIGIGFAVRDLMLKKSIELGGECSSSDHCKSGTCLQGNVSVCTKSCSRFDACPTGFWCVPVKVTLHNQGGFHDMGTSDYCMPAAGGAASASAAASASSAPSASTPAPVAASASPEPAPAPSASAPSAATSKAKAPAGIKPKTTPKPTPKPKK